MIVNIIMVNVIIMSFTMLKIIESKIDMLA